MICKKLVEYDRTKMTIGRMRVAYWIPKTTDTLSEYVIYFYFPLQKCLFENASYCVTSTACLVATIFKCNVNSVWLSEYHVVTAYGEWRYSSTYSSSRH